MTDEPRRTLAVDPGQVRVGLAVTDSGGMIATPLEVIPAKGATERIAKTVADLNVGTVVVGLPLNMDGSEGPSAAAAREFAAALEARGVRVELLDERLTTVTAERGLIESGHRRGKRREIQDAVAAAVLLEAYLARQRNAASRAAAGEET
mgnify:CR=1 FL=1